MMLLIVIAITNFKCIILKNNYTLSLCNITIKFILKEG